MRLHDFPRPFEHIHSPKIADSKFEDDIWNSKNNVYNIILNEILVKI